MKILLTTAMFFGFAFSKPGALFSAENVSVIIRGATVIDGTGTPGVKADVALKGDRIAMIAPVIRETAAVEIKAEGLVLAPGFIDAHSHADATMLGTPFSNNKILQGVTTELVGHCGGSLFL